MLPLSESDKHFVDEKLEEILATCGERGFKYANIYIKEYLKIKELIREKEERECGQQSF